MHAQSSRPPFLHRAGTDVRHLLVGFFYVPTLFSSHVVVGIPKGQRGFFYRLVTGAMEGKNTIEVTHLPYTVAVGKLIDEDFSASARVELGPLFPQEYECAFLGSGMAAFPAELVDSARADYEVQDL